MIVVLIATQSSLTTEQGDVDREAVSADTLWQSLQSQSPRDTDHAFLSPKRIPLPSDVVLMMRTSFPDLKVPDIDMLHSLMGLVLMNVEPFAVDRANIVNIDEEFELQNDDFEAYFAQQESTEDLYVIISNLTTEGRPFGLVLLVGAA